MNYYELMVVIHSALEGGRLKDIIHSITEQLKQHSCDILYTDVWGKKKLAYFIDKQKYGTYVLIQFKGDGKGNANLLVELEHNPNILTYLISSISENDILEQSDDIDDQIPVSEKPPVKEAPAEEAVSEEAPAEEAVSEEAPAEEAVSEEDSAEDVSDDTVKDELDAENSALKNGDDDGTDK